MSTSDDIGELNEVEEADPLVGTRLGCYSLLEELGSGGMCAVYRARHMDFGTEFAVKVLHPGRTQQEVFTHRLRREAAAGLRLNHPNIVRVVELGMGPQGPFLVMELLVGRTLHEALRTDGPIPPPSAAKIVRQTADGLSAAHRAGFVHRDLKPGNIMLVPGELGEEVKILDLGIVGVTTADPREQITRENLVVGTPAYMAPEQFHGSSSVGPQADLYSLGVVLYQMLRGRPPFDGNFQEIIAQHMMTPPDPLPDSDGLEELAYWLLEKSQAKRPQNAAEVIAFVDRHFPNCANANIVPHSLHLLEPLTPLPLVQAESLSDAGAVGLAVEPNDSARCERLIPISRLVTGEEARGATPLEGGAEVERITAEAPFPEREPSLPRIRLVSSSEAPPVRLVPPLAAAVALEAPPIPQIPGAPRVPVRRASSSRSNSRIGRRARFSQETRFKPARRLRWPLRLAIPMVWSVALVGGAYSAQRLFAGNVVEWHEAPARVTENIEVEHKPDLTMIVAPRTISPDITPTNTAVSVSPRSARPQKELPSSRIFEQKLHKAARALYALAKQKKIAPAELVAFEDWYLELAENSRPGLSEADTKNLIARTDMLVARMSRLVRKPK